VTTVGEIMTSDVFATDPDASVSETAAAMLHRRFGSAVVTTGSMVLGILTERDVLRAAASGSDLGSSPVSEWMTPDPITAEPGMDADDAIELMMANGFRHLPVLDGAKLAGIVSLRDIVRTSIRRNRPA
jgi:CBS domain-containing protein